MTVITWRSGIMASDSCWNSFGTQTVSMIKIKRLTSGCLLGSAGENDSRAMEELLDRIKDPRKLPSRKDLIELKLSYTGLIAFLKGGVYMISTGKTTEAGYAEDDDEDMGVWPATTMGGFAACGCGSDYALAAMHAHPSVTAAHAVRIACHLNVNCRLPVHTVRLHNDPRSGSRHHK